MEKGTPNETIDPCVVDEVAQANVVSGVYDLTNALGRWAFAKAAFDVAMGLVRVLQRNGIKRIATDDCASPDSISWAVLHMYCDALLKRCVKDEVISGPFICARVVWTEVFGLVLEAEFC